MSVVFMFVWIFKYLTHLFFNLCDLFANIFGCLMYFYRWIYMILCFTIALVYYQIKKKIIYVFVVFDFFSQFLMHVYTVNEKKNRKYKQLSQKEGVQLFIKSALTHYFLQKIPMPGHGDNSCFPFFPLVVYIVERQFLRTYRGFF